MMSEESTTPDLVELTRSLWEAASRRDLDAVMGFFGPEAVWETTLVTLDGSAAIRERLEEWFGAFDELEFELEEILDLGNGVNLTGGQPKSPPSWQQQQQRWLHATARSFDQRVGTGHGHACNYLPRHRRGPCCRRTPREGTGVGDG